MEYLEDYEQRETAEYERLVLKRIETGTFDFERDSYPSDERFINLQKPVAMTTANATRNNGIWGQIPFCGSTIICIPPVPKALFEASFFNANSIPQVIDFVKETGRLQIALSKEPTMYVGLDYLEPFFAELSPPIFAGFPIKSLGDEKEIHIAKETFATLARVQMENLLEKMYNEVTSHLYPFLRNLEDTYLWLKLGRYTIVEEIENLMVDDPLQAVWMLRTCQQFITNPQMALRPVMVNYSLEDLTASQILPVIYRPRNLRFPCDIGKFLMKDKLTYAPCGLGACRDLIYHYDSYDLQKVQTSLNEAIVTNHPATVSKSAKEISEILDNAWNDKTIPKRIKNIQIGVPVSIAAVGGIVAGLPGAFAGGLLSELGFKIVEKATEKYAEKLFGVKGEGLTERLAKLRTKSYQANVYDFKKKYNR